MPFLLILILIALVTESFSTSWNSGAIHAKLKEQLPVRLPFSLAVIKSVVLALGLFIGMMASGYLPFFTTPYALVFIIGLKIITESFRFAPEERIVLVDNTKTLLLVSVAGSFNTLFIGLGLGLLGVSILLPVAFNLTATLIASLIALKYGAKKGLTPYTRYAGIAAGIIIAAIALRYFIMYFL